MTGPAYPSPTTRWFITISVMIATIMNGLDSTIAAVALPNIQGSVSASQDEITWVLTSYIIAAAIFTPLTGWLAGRFGRKRLMLVSVAGFTLVSVLCGLASGLNELVAYRLLQGVFGAALLPMSQAILLDINPPEQHGAAMAIWGTGGVLGPIIGPALGGWLTDNMSWHWVFFINLPFGILAWLGIAGFLSESKNARQPSLDLFGFAALALGIGALQLMLDRGQQQDWFSSREIWIEATISVFFFYIFIVQVLTAKKPFIDLSLFRDRNFVLGCFFGFFLNLLMFAVLALLPPMLAGLLGYSVELTGLVTAPRGLGTLLTMFLAGQLMKRFGVRTLILVGLSFNAWSMYDMSHFSLDIDTSAIIRAGFIQGLAIGLIFVPLSTIAFATLDQRLRNEGAAMFTLIRNIGSAIGISVLQTMTIRNSAVVHSRLVEGIRPDNPVMDWRLPDFDFGFAPAVARLNAELTRHGAIVSYIDTFWLLFIVSLTLGPVVLLMRPARPAAKGTTAHLHME